jgi:HPt (histidine-containing phosphotransfer) domain-containing protein
MSLKKSGDKVVGQTTVKQRVEGKSRGVDRLIFDRELFETTTMHDSALQLEILNLFIDQLRVVQTKLRVASLSLEDCKFLGHTLRGAAAAVGAGEIEQLAAAWEARSLDQKTLQQKLELATFHFEQATAIYAVH